MMTLVGLSDRQHTTVLMSGFGPPGLTSRGTADPVATAPQLCSAVSHCHCLLLSIILILLLFISSGPGITIRHLWTKSIGGVGLWSATSITSLNCGHPAFSTLIS